MGPRFPWLNDWRARRWNGPSPAPTTLSVDERWDALDAAVEIGAPRHALVALQAGTTLPKPSAWRTFTRTALDSTLYHRSNALAWAMQPTWHWDTGLHLGVLTEIIFNSRRQRQLLKSTAGPLATWPVPAQFAWADWVLVKNDIRTARRLDWKRLWADEGEELILKLYDKTHNELAPLMRLWANPHNNAIDEVVCAVCQEGGQSMRRWADIAPLALMLVPHMPDPAVKSMHAQLETPLSRIPLDDDVQRLNDALTERLRIIHAQEEAALISAALPTHGVDRPRAKM